MELFLTTEIIREALNLSEVEYQNLLEKHGGKGIFTQARLEKVMAFLRRDSLRLFNVDESAIDWVHVPRNVKRMLSVKAPQKISIGKNIKRKRSSSSHMSVGSTSNMSFEDFESSETERSLRQEAEREVLELKAKLSVVQPLLDFFVKDKQTRGKQTFKNEIDTFILKSLADGRSAAATHDFFVNLTEMFPFLLDDSDAVIPSITYIERLRECLPVFNQARLEKFVDEAECLTILTDDSPAQDQGRNYSSLGIIDETGLYCNIGFMQNDNKSSVGICETMQKVLKESDMKEKILAKLNQEVSIMSDSAHAQRLANRIFLERSNVHMGNSAICLMHTTSNCETYSYECLEEKFKNGLHSLKLLFGSRNSSGYHRISLKKNLNDVLGLQNRSVFKTNLGSRYGVNSGNARALILNKREVLIALNSAKPMETHSMRVKMLLSTDWENFALMIGVFSLFFFAVLAPFHTIISQTVPWKVAKTAIETAQSHMNQLKDPHTDVIETLYRISECQEISVETKQMVTILRGFHQQLSFADIMNVAEKLRTMAGAALVKFQKDTTVLIEQSISDHSIVPLTNRRAESSFAAFKWNERKFNSISKFLLVNVTIAKINHLSRYISEMVNGQT